jgi:hypothetical protein
MKRLWKQITASVAALIICTSVATASAFADSDDAIQSLILQAGINNKLSAPLSLTQSSPQLFLAGNLNPGDNIKAQISFSNPSDQNVQMCVSQITNEGTSNPTLSNKLFEQLPLKISYQNIDIYNGKYSETTTPVTNWINVPPKKDITIDVDFSVPLELDNTYQNVPLKVKWTFNARSSNSGPTVGITSGSKPISEGTNNPAENQVQGAATAENQSNPQHDTNSTASDIQMTNHKPVQTGIGNIIKHNGLLIILLIVITCFICISISSMIKSKHRKRIYNKNNINKRSKKND